MTPSPTANSIIKQIQGTWSIPPSKQDKAALGDMANYLSMALNVVVTLSVLLDFPSHDTFDEQWRQDGQCYADHIELARGITMDTSTLCCLLLCGSAAVAMALWYQQKDTILNAYLVRRLPKTAQSYVSHGLGHYFVHLIGGSIPHVRPFSLAPADVGYTLVLLVFLPATLRATMPRLPLVTAFLIGLTMIAFQAAIDIAPHMQFSFTQAVILLFQSLDMLTSTSRTEKQQNPVTYLAFSAYAIPLYPLLWLEVTQCSAWLADMGGHVLYDLYLSLFVVFMAYYLPQIEPSVPQKSSKKVD